ncbi:hypothetical protein U5801_22380 [Lamprobacter modestohalophilus]|uniref:hypothetical protein n=1 Tax=Lamprobacter modestohalophilus TaxID=1064514 RepID=UPI002ADED0FF|nr:hypothetical protein [Lamprobacter modestohalophilus]MEA1052532.1 hypothetical protein [Lamprobacter modestohalophilus]
MDYLALAFALLLPWLAATLWLQILWRGPQPRQLPQHTTAGRWPMLLGYGYILGALLSAALLYFTGISGLPLSVWPALLVISLFAFGAVWLIRNPSALPILAPQQAAQHHSGLNPQTAQSETDASLRDTAVSPSVHASPPSHASSSEQGMTPGRTALPQTQSTMPAWQWVIFTALLISVGIRLTGLALELWWQPLFPWDAWTTWGVRARVWTELHSLVPFIAPEVWLADPDSPAYTIEAYDYPLTVSLLAAWPALAYGDWNESVAKLPWLGCALALALAFYGQVRRWGGSPLAAMIFIWGLFSLPLLNSHIALAGYADLWMATLVGLAFMAFAHWARARVWRDGLLAVVLVICLPLIKEEGAVWAALFLPALIAYWLPSRWWLVIAAVALGAVLLALVATDLEQVLPMLNGFTLEYQGAWRPIWEHLFVRSSWHLFAMLMLLTLTLAIVQELLGITPQPQYRSALAWVLAVLTGFYILFFWTVAAQWAAMGTSINRVLIQFVPAFIFWMYITFSISWSVFGKR